MQDRAGQPSLLLHTNPAPAHIMDIVKYSTCYLKNKIKSYWHNTIKSGGMHLEYVESEALEHNNIANNVIMN